MTDTCNIGAPGVARRRGLGLVALLLAAGASAWVIAAGFPWVWRCATLPLFWFAALGLLQAREKV